MAARGSIPQMMAAAGIDMLAPEAGIPVIRRELTAGGRRGEILIAGRLGILEEERHPTGGLDVAAVSPDGRGPMLGRVARPARPRRARTSKPRSTRGPSPSWTITGSTARRCSPG